MSNMIVCPEPLAAKVGQDIFARGGNAVDAAIASAFAQGVTNPLLCGLGGTGVMYYYDAKKCEGIILDFEVTVGSRPVPDGWMKEFAGRAETVGRYILKSEANQIGHQSVMTPGFVRGLWTAFQRFGSGKLSWKELLAPAVKLARDGFQIYPYIGGFWQNQDDRPGYPSLMRKLNATPDARRIYLKPNGDRYEEGDWFVQAEYGQTLQRLADAGGDDFYTGEIGRAIAEDFEKHDALMTRSDLQTFPVDDQQPISGRFRDVEITTTPVSSSGGHLIEILQILEHFDLKKLRNNSPKYIDTFARVLRGTFADNVKLKCMDVKEAMPLEAKLISPRRATYWAKRIKSGDRVVVRGGAADIGTTHLVSVDTDRNVVTLTHSIGSLAGSGVITPGLGFLFNNFLGHFNPLPGYPDSIAPLKRGGGGVPAIVFEDGKPLLAIGAPGGSRIITSVAQAIVNAIEFGMDMRTAVTAPRFHSEEEQLLLIEPQFPERTAQALRKLGNDVRRSTYMSRVQSILIRPDTGELEAGADPRGGAGVGRYPVQPAGGG